MKRLPTLFLLLSLFSFANLSAQEHLRFMGIPLTGTINQFQAKLQAKGVRYNRELSSVLPVGTRAFNCTFSGYKAHVAVYYNNSSHIVYGAKVYVDELSEERANAVFEEFKQNVISKYGVSIFDETKDGTYYAYIFGKKLLNGIISIYKREEETYYNYPYIHSVHIQYIDRINNNANEATTLEDY